ncbi:unnamed protein product, partial [Didymodactylos carnosus]
DLESYIHRSGRTGRAGKAGIAICLFRPNQSIELEAVERRAVSIPSADIFLSKAADVCVF